MWEFNRTLTSCNSIRLLLTSIIFVFCRNTMYVKYKQNNDLKTHTCRYTHEKPCTRGIGNGASSRCHPCWGLLLTWKSKHNNSWELFFLSVKSPEGSLRSMYWTHISFPGFRGRFRSETRMASEPLRRLQCRSITWTTLSLHSLPIIIYYAMLRSFYSHVQCIIISRPVCR